MGRVGTLDDSPLTPQLRPLARRAAFVGVRQLLSSTEQTIRCRRVFWQHMRLRATPDFRKSSALSLARLQLAFNVSQVVVDQRSVLVPEPSELLLNDLKVLISHVIKLNQPRSRALDAAQ